LFSSILNNFNLNIYWKIKGAIASGKQKLVQVKTNADGKNFSENFPVKGYTGVYTYV
jgi:hypothetical protein